MRLWRSLLLLSIVGIVLINIVQCDPKVDDEDDEDDEDDGIVEVEEETIEEAKREKVYFFFLVCFKDV
jgi:hypothetical protein